MVNINRKFNNVLDTVGLTSLEQAVFYSAPIGIRFKIGGEEDIYLYSGTDSCITNPAYVHNAVHRAVSIYKALPAVPDLLCINIFRYSEDDDCRQRIQNISHLAKLPQPLEKCNGSSIRLYWNLEQLDYDVITILREIVIGDIGGNSDFVSSVFFVNSSIDILFHLYDDRGVDVVAADRDVLCPLYENFNDWILDYDREKIDLLFKN